MRSIDLSKKRFFFQGLYLFGITVSLSAQTLYFVSPDGNDTNKGTESAPFQMIEAAQMEARAAKGTVTIYLREGEHRLKKPIIFTPVDGHGDKQLMVCSYPGEQAVISGGAQLELDWQPYQNGIMKANVNSGLSIDMLTVNGKIRPMARFPNYDSTAVRFNGTSADATSPERVKSWKNPAGGFLHAMHVSDWGDFHYRILGKHDDGTLQLESGWQNQSKWLFSGIKKKISSQSLKIN